MYDEMMDEIPYEKWFECVRDYLEVQGYEKDSKVCELGCGTGTLTRMFHQAGYDIMGVDLSEEMLMEAREKCPDVMLVQQTAADRTSGCDDRFVRYHELSHGA